jgi:hypothetical protein
VGEKRKLKKSRAFLDQRGFLADNGGIIAVEKIDLIMIG